MNATVALARSAHPLPSLAVTVLTTALAVTGDVSGGTTVVLALAVFTGQLVIGWSNDLFDRERDRQVGRRDKPLALGAVSPQVATVAAVVAGAICVITSLACGWAAGTVHLVLGIGAGLAYNAGLKSTVISWLPYLVAVGSVPVVVALAADPDRLPPVWIVVVAALLGVGAHLVNALPDLDDDAATGVRGLPHRLGPRRIPVVAAVLLVGATAVCVVATDPQWWGWAGLAVVVALVVASVRASGRWPFYASMLVATIDVVVLVLA